MILIVFISSVEAVSCVAWVWNPHLHNQRTLPKALDAKFTHPPNVKTASCCDLMSLIRVVSPKAFGKVLSNARLEKSTDGWRRIVEFMNAPLRAKPPAYYYLWALLPKYSSWVLLRVTMIQLASGVMVAIKRLAAETIICNKHIHISM